VIRVTRISHAVFETPDLSRQIDYYANVVGFHVLSQDSKQAYLANASGQEVVAFEAGTSTRCLRVAFQVSPEFDHRRIDADLQKSGIAHEHRSDPSPFVSQATAFTDPKGTEVLLFSEQKHVPIPKHTAGIGPIKLGHIAFAAPSAQAIADFYVNTLGFRVSDWIEDKFAFLRCGPDHHTVNFLNGPSTFMHHIAYELRDRGHLLDACDMLAQERRPIIWGPGRHRVGHNLFVFHRDPDGNIIELYAELDLLKDEALGYFEPRPWHKTNPQKPTVWSLPDSAPVWGMAPSADFRRSGNTHLNPTI
jgi:catechol 2,3-dioxygenase-like lactoylglutathione lyase family enzyme